MAGLDVDSCEFSNVHFVALITSVRFSESYNISFSVAINPGTLGVSRNKGNLTNAIFD